MPDAFSKQHLATLDILRLVAALAVVAYHFLFRGAVSGEQAVAFPEAAPFAIYGYLGVNLFFMISGFVIAWSAEGRSFESFALARFIRLYPAHLICMTLTFVAMAVLMPAAFPVSGAQYAANLTMLAPAFGQPFMDGVYWSIVLELVFYGWVALALLAGVFERYKLELIAGGLVLCALNEFAIGSGALRMLFLTEFGPFFIAGVLMHHMMSRGLSQGALALLVLAFLMSVHSLSLARDWMLEHYGEAVPVPGLLAANVAMYLLVYAAIRYRGKMKASAWTLAVGGLTYPLYLLHQHIGYAVIDLAAPRIGGWLAVTLVAVAMIAASWAIWRFAEKPTQLLLRTTLAPRVMEVAEAIRRRLQFPFRSTAQ